MAIIAFIKMNDVPAVQEQKFHYRAVQSVLDKREVMLFQELKKQLPEGYHIFPKMRLADIMETTATGREFHGQFNRISKKHVDFLICNQNYKPVLAIELNGSSHQKIRTQRNDEFKKEVFKNIGLRLEVIQIGTNFAASVDELFTDSIRQGHV